MKYLVLFASIAALCTAVSAYHKCCPQPESEGMCDCCPDACCCICENITVTSTPAPTTSAPPPTATTTIECNVMLDVIIIADSSDSVGQVNWTTAMDFLAQLVTSDVFPDVGTATRVGMIEFDSFAVKHWGVNDAQSDSAAALADAFLALPWFRGFTNISDGYFMAIDEFENNDRDDDLYKDVAIVMSDGRQNRGNSTIDEAIAGLEEATELIFGIGITDRVDLDFMTKIVGGNSENVVLVVDFQALIDRLTEIVNAIKESICKTIVSPTPPPNTPAPPVPGTSVIVPNCKCCCPPLPDPCDYYPGIKDPCCCKHDLEH